MLEVANGEEAGRGGEGKGEFIIIYTHIIASSSAPL